MSDEPASEQGWVAEELRAELPGLGVVSLALPAPRLGRSPQGVRAHLDALSARFRGADALALRQRPIPHAYRVCFRHVGLDPDVTRVPVEAAAIERLVHGGFRSVNLLDDALTIALVETGVPIWALDGDAVDGPLGLRLARAGESLGRGADALPVAAGRIVVADAAGPLGPLFGDPAPGCGVTRRTRRLLLFAVRVDGVSAMHVEEALWMAVEALRTR
jgi:DNA/RNA-binding domain of Phe-tRNA-synthetase-like protein